MIQRCLVCFAIVISLAACGAIRSTTVQPGATTSSSTSGDLAVLRLATTTSTADSGLLNAIVPDFEQRYNVRVEVVAVGTGQALKLGENGDVDVLLVHARAREDQFVAQGYGVNRHDVMYNDFVIVGPREDRLLANTTTAADAFRTIADAGATFASRGDDSGTFTKEQSIWASVGITPTADLDWYKSLGQGMGETLTTANELGAYTLSDRATYLAQRDALPNLAIHVGGESIDQNTDGSLRNPYGVIQVNPTKYPGVNAELAASFVQWITSPEIQHQIGQFGVDRVGQPLFYPEASAQP